MRTVRSRPALPVALALLAACGGGGGGGGQVDLQEGVWTWADVAGTRCGDGSSTGLAVNLGTGGDLVVFLDGGGACWDATTCYLLAEYFGKGGPYGETQFEAELEGVGGTVLDRSSVPALSDATLVFIPYCTGDVHWGDSVQTYDGLGSWHHAGKANLVADLAWLAERLAAPTRLVVMGSSAGGYGALLAHDLARTTWPDAQGYLVDDSGPPLVGDDISASLRASWYAQWGLSGSLSDLCPRCADDLSLVIPALAEKYPDDRLALVSSLEDSVIRTYLDLSPTDFQAALLKLVDERIAPLAGADGARAFLASGSNHALLEAPADYAAGEVTLPDWLAQLVGDDAAWATQGR